MAEYIIEEMRRFNYLLSEIGAAYHEVNQRLGLSDSAMQILYAICHHGEECLLSEICKMSGTSKQTINSALRNLEKWDYVRLESLAGRRKRVCLTARGKELVGGTALRLIGIENEVFGSWTKQERELYLSMTQRYLTSFRDKAKELFDQT